MKACIVIPHYNHGGAIGHVIAALRPLGLPCRIVDDGSDVPSLQALERALESERTWVSLQRLPKNQGKGAAVRAGCEAVYAEGFTHAVQIDADGQHRIEDVPRLLEIARQRPEALVSGQAVYDRSVPRA